MDTQSDKTMAGIPENGGGRTVSRLRIAGWTAAAVILLLPLVAMQFTEEVNWSLSDFVIFGFMLAAVGIAFELAVRISSNIAYRSAVGVALLGAFLLVWANLAVGIIGNEGNDANLMYGGVLAVGLIGAVIARFGALGMARAMFATAIAQALVAVIALVAGWGSTTPIWPLDILGATALFVTLWLGSAWLFRTAAEEQPSADAVPEG